MTRSRRRTEYERNTHASCVNYDLLTALFSRVRDDTRRDSRRHVLAHFSCGRDAELSLEKRHANRYKRLHKVCCIKKKKERKKRKARKKKHVTSGAPDTFELTAIGRHALEPRSYRARRINCDRRTDSLLRNGNVKPVPSRLEWSAILYIHFAISSRPRRTFSRVSIGKLVVRQGQGTSSKSIGAAHPLACIKRRL